VAQGRVGDLRAIPHTFAADLAPDDRVLATGG
jgi:hypothetical protein